MAPEPLRRPVRRDGERTARLPRLPRPHTRLHEIRARLRPSLAPSRGTPRAQGGPAARRAARSTLTAAGQSKDRDGADPLRLLLVLSEPGVPAGLLGIDAVALLAGDLDGIDVIGL